MGGCIEGRVEGVGELAGDESGDTSGGGDGDHASDSGAFSAGMEHGGKGAFAPMQGFDAAGIDVDRAFGEKESRTPFGQFCAGGQGEGDVEHGFTRGLDEDGRGDASFDFWTDRSGLGQGLARPYALGKGFSGKAENFGSGPGTTLNDEG